MLFLEKILRWLHWIFYKNSKKTVIYIVKFIFFGKFDKIGSTSLKTKISHFCEKNLKNGVQRVEFKTWFFSFFCKNPKEANLDFLYKIQENRVLYCKINLLVKFHLIGYTSVNTKIVHFCDKTSKMAFSG